MARNSWRAVFELSRINYGYYDESGLPHWTWTWPKETWFQLRRNALRDRQSLWPRGKSRELSHGGVDSQQL